MNPDARFRLLTEIPPLPNRLPFNNHSEPYPAHWNPVNVPDYESGVIHRIETLVGSDWAQHRKRHPTRPPYGRPLADVYHELFVHDDPLFEDLAGVIFGASRMTKDKFPEYEIFMRSFLGTLLDWARDQHFGDKLIRILLGTGSGPGFAMQESIEILRDMAIERGMWENQASAYGILADLRKEPPCKVPPFRLTARGQGELGERYSGLIVPARYAFICPGGPGTDDELGSSGLENQMFGTEGPMMLGARVIFLLDSVIPDAVCDLAQIPRGTRYFDYWETKRRQTLALHFSSTDDYLTFVRVNIDSDPELRGKEVAQDVITLFGLTREIQKHEHQAVRLALAMLDKKFKDKNGGLVSHLRRISRELYEMAIELRNYAFKKWY